MAWEMRNVVRIFNIVIESPTLTCIDGSGNLATVILV